MSAHPDTPDVDHASMEDRLYTITYTDEGESHLGVTDPAICAEDCDTNECVTICPAEVWEVGEDGVPDIAYENCLECGSCRFACPYDNVEWRYPATGDGVKYKFG